MRTAKLIVICLFVILPCRSNATTAADLVKTCEKVADSSTDKGKYIQAHSEAIEASGQCEGFIEGWLEGIDGAILQLDGKAVVLSIKWSEMPGVWKIYIALRQHLENTPLDSGKSADTVLQKVLRTNGLINLQSFTPPVSEVQ